MTFRIEEKLFIDSNQIIDFKKYIFTKKATELYPKRKINSLYFDNDLFQMYNESEEGCVPRKKLRIRNYPNAIKKEFFMEIKINSVEGRFKTTENLNQTKYNEYLKIGYLDQHYGYCDKKIYVSYSREYYTLNNFRITIDTDIIYRKPNDNLNISYDNEIAVEIKTNKISDIILLNELFPFTKSRFSKYCRGCANLF